jgi:hypothetical protein
MSKNIAEFFETMEGHGFTSHPRRALTTYRNGATESTLDYILVDSRASVTMTLSNPCTRHCPKVSHLAVVLRVKIHLPNHGIYFSLVSARSIPSFFTN